jgi:hypothetical protein
MATTHTYQVKPDYYDSKEACVASVRQRVNTNPRYKNFYQTHFTAGDEEQFETHRDPTNGQVCIPDIDLAGNRFRDYDIQPVLDWEKYRNIPATAVMNTFYYMFEKFLAVFLPFSKKNFTNEWAKYVQIDRAKYGDMVGFIQYIRRMEKRGGKFFARSVNKFVDSWYANNCLVRYEFPINEGDTNHPNMSDMFRTLCAERDVPDMEFFVNRRDFPIIKKDGTEAYEHMFGKNHPLESHKYDKYAPILSMVTKNGYADIPIPTGEDWARIGSGEGKFFPKACREYLEDFISVPWDDKKPTAVFRGGSTGCGVTVDTNMRLKLAYLSKVTPKDTDGLPLLDAGITNWNLRPRKLRTERYLQTIDITSLPFGLVDRLTPQEQTGYKYIVHVDGHVSAFRLSLELGMGCCILLVASKYKLWYRSMLKPYVHYVPVRSDLSDLVSQVKWCKEHDAKCEEIAANAKRFHDTYLMKEGVLDYLQNLLYKLKQENGVYFYNQTSPFDLQIRSEEKQLDYEFPNIGKTIADIHTIPSQARSFGMLKGMHWILNMVNNEGRFFEVAEKNRLVFKSVGSIVEEYFIGGFSVIAKSSLRVDKDKESIHEVFVSTKCINGLLKYVPNFMYNFGMCRDAENRYVTLTEPIVGQTMSDYIKGSDFTMRDYLFILMQTSLALHTAQQQCALVHNDLTPWNIIIQKLPEPMDFDYIIDSQTVYTVTTQIVPVIIDFGKSHVVYDDIHYGAVNMYKTSTIQDILTLLATSIYEITDRKLTRRDVNELVKLANFISGTTYRRREFLPSGRGGVGDLRYFFRNAKKYTRLVSDPKHELEQKTPLDFFNYLQKNFGRFPVRRAHSVVLSLDKGNARQVFRYTLSNTRQEKIESFTRVFSRVRKCPLPEMDNLLLVYYILQSLETNLQSVYDDMIRFLQNESISTAPYATKYQKAMKHVRNMYNNVLTGEEMKDIVYDVGDFTHLEQAPYNVRTFLIPAEILRLQGQYAQNETSDLASYKNEIMTTLLHSGKFSLPQEVREHYQQNCAKLLHTNSLYMKNRVANGNTLRITAAGLYSIDREVMSAKIADESGDCTVAQEYLSVYSEILS